MWNTENDSRKVGPGDEVDWLRSDLDESPVIAIKKKSLVNKLDDLARRKFGDDGQWCQVEAPSICYGSNEDGWDLSFLEYNCF